MKQLLLFIIASTACFVAHTSGPAFFYPKSEPTTPITPNSNPEFSFPTSNGPLDPEIIALLVQEYEKSKSQNKKIKQ